MRPPHQHTVVFSLVLLLLCSMTALAADPILFTQKALDRGEFWFFPVTGYASPDGETGLFLTEQTMQEGYQLALQPGEASLIVAKTPAALPQPAVITLEYAVLQGQATVAVAALNAADAIPDGQVGYSQFTAQAGGPRQRLHVLYSAPSGMVLPAAQVSLDEAASGPAVVVLYSLSIHEFRPQSPAAVPLQPAGTFESPEEGYLRNVNQDTGEVRFLASQDVALQTPGQGAAANLGVTVHNSTPFNSDTLLLASVDVARVAAADGMTGLVMTNGAWHTVVFVDNTTLATEWQTLTIGGSYIPSDAPVYLFAQNGGGMEGSQIKVDNLVLQQLDSTSILNLPADQPVKIPESLAVSMMLPTKLFTGSQSSFSLTSMDENQSPVSLPYQVFLSQSGSKTLVSEGVTDAQGFANQTFTIPPLNPGTWKIEVRSFGEMLVSGQAVVQNGGVLLIETDKPIYKPGQTMQGRVIYANNTLAPLQGDVELSISDAKGIKIYKAVLHTNEFGVAPFTLPLANELNFGIWKITAKIGTTIQTERDIEVDKYVLPAFDVQVALPKSWCLSDERITGVVDSKFFFGKPVQGQVTIKALKYVSTWESFATVTGRLEEGRFAFDLPAAGYVAGTPGAEGAGTVQLKVTVTDDTGHEESTDQLVTIVSSGLQLKLIPESPALKPGLEQELLIVSQSPEGTPLDAALQVELSFMASDGSELSRIDQKVQTQNGLTLFTFPVPEKTQMAIAFARGSLDGKAEEESLVLNAVYSPGAHFIHLRQKNEGILAVGTNAHFDVFATSAGTVYYDVFANGRTLFSKAIDGNLISFTVTPEMSPKAKLVAYKIQPNNEVSVDVLPFEVELQTPADLQVTFSAEEVKPGDPVSLSIHSEGEAMVGLSIVDESVFALAKGRLNLRNVFAELEKIFMEPQVETHPSPDEWYPRVDINAKGAADLLEDHNLQILTTRTLQVPKAQESDPWVFWGRLPNKFMPLFPVPVGVEDAEAVRGGEQDYQEPDRVRSFFPETWLWLPDLKTDALGRASLDLTAPDSITTWKLHALSTSPQGIGITENSLRVFQDFFADPDLPYAVIRGDRFPLRVRLFNYVDEPQHIRVTLEDTEGLGLLDEAVQEVDLPAGGIASVTFTLQPKKVGLLPVSIIAQSARRADAIRKDLRVEPEGAPRSIVFNGILKDATEVTIDLKYPEDRIADSDKLKVNITPSLLGQSMSGLEDLLGMPYGCGEQNMIFLAPDIEVLRYFKFTGQVVPAIQAKAETFITTGYQRQLTYRHTDGSFSAFGEQDESGSLWLTAFVLSTLSNARDVQTIDETVLANAANWMLGHQAADGSWEPVGTVIHQEMIGGVDGSLGISAFVTISLLDYGQADTGKVNQALDYLASHLTDERLDPYILALTTYALARAERPETATAIDLLLQAAIADSQGLHWDPHPVETTAYAAMALLLSDRMEAQQALDWLSMQRNAFGGFHSTQDTVVGLKAMTLAALSQSRNLDATLEVVVNGQTIHTFQANQANFDVLQSLEMTPADAVTLKMSGTGKLYYQVAQGYNMPLEREIPGPIPGENPLQLTVNYSAEHIAVDDIVDVQVSVLYKGEQEQTGMSIVDISIPTGFAVVADSLEKLKCDPNFKRIDQAGRKVIFYLDHFTKDKPLDFGFQVKAQYPVRADSGASTAYLYYDTNTKAEAGGLELIVE